MRTKKKSSQSSGNRPEFDEAYERALRRLRLRDRFVEEIRKDLATLFDDATCHAVIHRLLERGLVDDARFVRSLIEANRGKRAVAVKELRRRCADRGADEASLLQFGQVDEPEAEALLFRFERSERGRARAYRLLASRGFNEEDALAALDRFLPKESVAVEFDQSED